MRTSESSLLVYCGQRLRLSAGERARQSGLDLDVAASRRTSQSKDEVAQREVLVAGLRQANATVDRARLRREVRESVCRAEVGSELLFVEEEARSRVHAVVVDRDEFELIVTLDTHDPVSYTHLTLPTILRV